MRTFALNKLVKDKIFESMENLGQTVAYRTLSDEELLMQMKEKLLEEVKEFNASAENAVAELADLLEVIETAGLALGKDFDSLRNIQLERREKRGGFTKKIFVEHVTLDDDDPWVKYYASEPERFTEIEL